MTSLGFLNTPIWAGPPITADVLLYVYLVCDPAGPPVFYAYNLYSNQM